MLPGLKSRVSEGPGQRILRLPRRGRESGEDEGRKEFPTLYQAAVLSLLAVALQLLVGTVLGVFLIAPDRLLANNVLAGATRALCFGLVIYICLYRSDFDLLKALFTFEGSVLLVGALVFTAAGLRVLLSEADHLFRLLVPLPGEPARFFENLVASRNPIAAAALLVLAAPLTEETLFRGFFLNGFLRNYSTAAAVLLSGFLSAFLALDPWQFTSAFALGCWLAWIFSRTGSLSACLLARVLAGALPLIFVHFSGLEVPGFTSGFGERVFQPLWLDLSAAGAVAVGGLLLFFHFRARRELLERRVRAGRYF